VIETLIGIIGATLRISTPLVFASLGEVITERAGMLNLSIEGTMYTGAFVGITVAAQTGSLTTGLIAAIIAGAIVGCVMGLLVVTLGVNQHVAGLGLTLLLISASNTANRILFTNKDGMVRVDPWKPFDFAGPIFSQYWLTYAAFLILAPALWWLLWRSGIGIRIRAVGENPESADVAGISVARTRYFALALGGALMAAGGAFITLAFLGSFTINIINGRGWVAIALVIFGRWGIWRTVSGALLFALVSATQQQLRLVPALSHLPFEILLALPYLAVIAGLAVTGRNVPYPGAYLKPYRRL